MKEQDLSGLDLDVGGGEVTTPVLIPASPADCVAADEGRCPPGCRQCERFWREWEEGSAFNGKG